jgi:phage-related protein
MAEQSVSVRIKAIDNITAPMSRIATTISGAFRTMRNAAGLATASLNLVGTTLSRTLPVAAGVASTSLTLVGSSLKRMLTIAAGLGIGGGLLAKSFLGAGMELEGYQAKLEVAMKSTEAAAEMMSWAQSFAATTPFEMSSVVDAATRLELYGLSAKKWLPLVGDMAGAMGRDVTQAVEAIADAVSGGGLERLKEFGVTSGSLKAAGWSGRYDSGGSTGESDEQKAAAAEKQAEAEAKLAAAQQQQAEAAEELSMLRRDWIEKIGILQRRWAERIADAERTSAKQIEAAQEAVWGATSFAERQERQERLASLVEETQLRMARMTRDSQEEIARAHRDSSEQIAQASRDALAQSIKAYQDYEKEMAEAAEATAGRGGSILDALQKVMQSRFGSGMSKMMATATGAISNFKDAVFSVRAALGTALLPLLKMIMPIVTAWTAGLGDKLREVGPAITEYLVGRLNALAEWFQKHGPKILAWVRGLWERFREALPAIIEFGSKVIQVLWAVGRVVSEWIIGQLTKLWEWVQANGTTILGWAQMLGEWLGKAGRAGWQALTWLVDKAREVGTVFMETVWPAIVNFATMVRDVLVPILVQQFGGSADYARGTIQALADMVARYLDAMTANLPSIAQKFSEFVSTWKDSFLPVIDRLVNELLPQFLEIGIAIVPVMLALSNAIMPVIDLIGAIAGGALDQITRITEPLSKGQYGQALWEGIKNPWNAFAVDAPGVFDEVYGGMKDRHAARQRWDAAQRNMPTVNNNIYLDGRRVAQTVNNQNQIASRECSRF